MRIIREQCAACDTAVADAQLRLACKRYDRLIERDGNYSVSCCSEMSSTALTTFIAERLGPAKPSKAAVPSRQDVLET